MPFSKTCDTVMCLTSLYRSKQTYAALQGESPPQSQQKVERSDLNSWDFARKKKKLTTLLCC